LSSFLLLSPLLEPSLLFFLLSVRSLLGAVAVTPPKKKNLLSLILCSDRNLIRQKLSIPNVPFQYYYQLSSGAGFRPSLQPSWSPLIFSFPFRSGGALRHLVPKWPLFLNWCGEWFHCLHSFSFLFSVGPLWLGLICLPVKEFYGTRYKVAYISLINVGSGFQWMRSSFLLEKNKD